MAFSSLRKSSFSGRSPQLPYLAAFLGGQVQLASKGTLWLTPGTGPLVFRSQPPKFQLDD